MATGVSKTILAAKSVELKFQLRKKGPVHSPFWTVLPLDRILASVDPLLSGQKLTKTKIKNVTWSWQHPLQDSKLEPPMQLLMGEHTRCHKTKTHKNRTTLEDKRLEIIKII